MPEGTFAAHTPLRVLYVNWVDYLDAEARGGGVSLYQRNLMAALAGRRDIEAAFVATGTAQDLIRRAPRWERMRHGPKPGDARRYEIVNARPLAPGHFSFGDETQISHPATEAAFLDLLAATGPWDVVHFNNLEGVPAALLPRLRAAHPGLRIVVTLHNYYPVCPQVNLWRAERESCSDFEGGAACTTCLTEWHPPARLRIAQGLAYHLAVLGFSPRRALWREAKRIGLGLGRRASRLMARRRAAPPKSTPETAPGSTSGSTSGTTSGTTPGTTPGTTGAPTIASPAYFAQRRRAMVEALNGAADHILAVSEATGAVARHYGIDPARITTSYIGTAQAALFEKTTPKPLPLPASPDAPLTLGYLGYMRRDKGFFFLLDALEALPAATLARLRLVVAARRGPPEAMARLAALGPRMAGLIHHDGYTHDTLGQVLAPVDLGLIPVLWHDNLPQVAIEMHARHIPLLTAARGGAPELGGHAALTHAPGDAGDFAARLHAVLAGQIDWEAYWSGARAPLSMETHLAALTALYRQPRPPQPRPLEPRPLRP